MAPPPHISIPQGAAPPTNPSPAPLTDEFDFVVTAAEPDPLGIYSRYAPANGTTSQEQQQRSPRVIPFPEPDVAYSRPPHSRPASVYEGSSSPDPAFHQPHIYRSPTTLRPSASYQHLVHRSTKSDTSISRPQSNQGESRPPSYISPESSPELSVKDLSDELSNVTLQSEEGLRRFQAGELPENDEEWYRLVPPEAIQVLDKKEVARQSSLFEIISSEKDYVRDMELIRDVFVDPLFNTAPIPRHRLKGFVTEVFYNMDEILAHHRRMLDKLFERQQDQHPLVQSIADIVLDTALFFQEPYEQYIKHYPLAEAHHRKELNRNSKYQDFLSQCAQDPRIRKQDLISLLTRPVTRLPRLLLQLDTVYKHTAPDHPDQETLPIIRGLLNDYIRSSQPGIEAAESKVKFWALCESLSYQKGEIIDLDLYDESRTLLYSGPLARRYRGDVGYSWADLHVALLDNYLLLMKPVRSNGSIRHVLISRPIPLEYLRLASFTAHKEDRKERTHSNTGESSSSRLFDFRSSTRYRPMYPLTIYHASAKLARRYTLYASSEAEREKWHKALVDAIGLRMARQDSNKWYAPHTINEGYFKIGSSPLGRSTGKINCATPMSHGGRNFVAVGCPSGIYVSCRGKSDFRRVLKKSNVLSLHTLQDYNKVLIHSDEGLESYSLEMIAGVALLSSRPQDLDATREDISGADVAVLFVRVGKIGGRTTVLYATKSFMQVTLHALEVLNPTEQQLSSSTRRSIVGLPSFRRFGEPVWIPKDSHDITALAKNIGICTERGIHVVDPTNLSASNANVTVIPSFNEQTEPMQALKQRCAGAKPLGLIRVPESSGNTGHRSSELLVIFDELGCYINRHGVPTRSSGYLRWESKATAVAHRGEHVMLFSPEFVEIRAICTGRLVQVIEGQDIRLVHTSERSALVAMRGGSADGAAIDKLVELVETVDLTVQTPQTAVPGLWDEWDM